MELHAGTFEQAQWSSLGTSWGSMFVRVRVNSEVTPCKLWIPTKFHPMIPLLQVLTWPHKAAHTSGRFL